MTADRLIHVDGRALLELEDLTRRYKHPSIVDIKVGLRTWYAGADPSHIERCKLKDAATTQAALGYKVCGMQVEIRKSRFFAILKFTPCSDLILPLCIINSISPVPL